MVGKSTEFCSCSSPCPCAFGQNPDNGRCHGVTYIELEDGEVEGTSLAGIKMILAVIFGPDPWFEGGMQGALIFDTNDSDEQREGLRRIFSGELGGEAAGLGDLITDLKGMFEAPFEGTWTDEQIAVKAGDYVDCSGSVLKDLKGEAVVTVEHARYFTTPVEAGKADRVRLNVGGLSYDGPGSGMWTGPFRMSGD
jgi:hypothetical protein